MGGHKYQELAQKLLLGRIDPEGVRDELYHTMACKSAIKAGMTTDAKELQALAKKYKVQRVVAELNGMQLVGDLYTRFPEDWVVAQEVMFVDSTTIMAYNANMRNLVMDKLVGAQMVVFNRLTPGADTMPFHKIARAANRRIDILYDYTDGTTAFADVEEFAYTVT